MSASAAAPAKFSGRDIGRRIVSGVRAYMTRSLGEFAVRVNDLAGRVGDIEQTVQSLPTLDVVQAEIQYGTQPIADLRGRMELIEADVRRMAMMDPEAAMARWELDFERRAQAVFERAIDRMPAPRDGVDGSDGESIEDVDIALNERDLTITIKIGERIVSKTVRLPMPIERGVFQSGKVYEKCDIVTFAGSQFIATRDTSGKEKPEDTSGAWRLIVKRGRDGKDAE